MKKFVLWFLAFLITFCAAIYQRMTGPTYPKRSQITVNDTLCKLNLTRSLSLSEKPEVKLNINDTSVKAKLFFKRYKTDEEYQVTDFVYKGNGFYATVPQQPPAGKIQYHFEITDNRGNRSFFKETPLVIRFKGDAPPIILIPHILFMFVAMLFSTLAGLMAIIKFPRYKVYSVWTLWLFIAGGIVLGPLVQYYAFGDLWTGIPFGWDLTDNKTLIALIFWIIAVVLNRKKERPIYTVLAAFILLLVYSIPHSLFGSELDYSTGEVTQGIILTFSAISFKFS